MAVTDITGVLMNNKRSLPRLRNYFLRFPKRWQWKTTPVTILLLVIAFDASCKTKTKGVEWTMVNKEVRKVSFGSTWIGWLGENQQVLQHKEVC